MTDTVVTQTIEIAAPPAVVWATLIDPVRSKLWRNAAFETDWRPGSPIRITAEIGRKRYRDAGNVLRVEPPALLSYEFLPGVSGLPDVPASYSTVTMTLRPTDAGTELTVAHTVPPSPIRRGDGWEIGPESGHKHVAFYWRTTLPVLRDLIEGRSNAALPPATSRKI
jgi:uncharacterized protein YndB with AHSA1/START domain